MADKLAGLCGEVETLPDYTQKNPKVVLQMANDQEEMLLNKVANSEKLVNSFIEKDRLSEKLLIEKDNVKQLLDDKILSLEGELLQIKAKTEAVCANRVVLEVGLRQWDRKEKKNIKGSGARCSKFVEENLADGKQLLADSADQLKNLGSKQLVVADVDVIRDCGKLFNAYTSMARYDTDPICWTQGNFHWGQETGSCYALAGYAEIAAAGMFQRIGRLGPGL